MIWFFSSLIKLHNILNICYHNIERLSHLQRDHHFRINEQVLYTNHVAAAKYSVRPVKPPSFSCSSFYNVKEDPVSFGRERTILPNSLFGMCAPSQHWPLSCLVPQKSPLEFHSWSLNLAIRFDMTVGTVWHDADLGLRQPRRSGSLCTSSLLQRRTIERTFMVKIINFTLVYECTCLPDWRPRICQIRGTLSISKGEKFIAFLLEHFFLLLNCQHFWLRAAVAPFV